ncbi:MAG: DUF3052 domain-containing protein [Gemmatimonadetes bacterium]|nr:MAG: DUF3052 domain-containing protein [Gemmatimonadota bacterium]
MAGYSGRSLAAKLGIKPRTRIAIIDPPRGYRATLGKLPDDVTVASRPSGSYPLIHFFTRSRAVLESKLPALLGALDTDGALWISWPKKSSGVATDMTEDVVRQVALPTGLVDIKVAAVDDVWSGLKLVRRLKNR